MQNEIQTNPSPQSDEFFIDIPSLINIITGKWYFFVLSVVIFMSIGFSIVYFSPRIYTKQATIYIKSENTGVGSYFKEISGMQGVAESNTSDEIIILSSRFLMEEVVKRLNLHISYYVDDAFRTKELYETLPFRLTSEDMNTLMPGQVIITPISDTKFSYYEEGQEPQEAYFGENLALSFGTVVLQPQELILNDFIDESVTVNIGSIEGAAAAFRASLNISTVNETSVLSLSISSSRPGKAEDILDTFMEVYNESSIDDKNKMIDNSNVFIANRLASVKQELNDIDVKVEEFKRQALASKTTSSTGGLMSAAIELEERQAELDIQINLLASLADFLSDMTNRTSLLPYNIGLADNNLNSQIQTYNDNLLRLNRLIDASSEQNPVVNDMRASLEVLRNSITKTVKSIQDMQQIKKRDLDRFANNTSGRMEASPTFEREIQSVMRDQQIKSELYLYLLNKSEENAILRSMTEPSGRILDKASGSSAPVSPKGKVIYLGCFVLGLLFPLVIIILADLLYSKVRGQSDIKRIISAPFLGELPRKSKSQQGKFMVVSSKNNTQLAEAYRILRSNLSFMLVKKDTANIIAVTSTQPGEGKTYLSANLSQTLALSNKRVLLIGLDLRRPTLQGYFKLKGQQGVSEFLSGQRTDLSNLVHRVGTDVLFDFLPAGVVPPNPAELLISDRYELLISELEDKYDYIIIDNPPYGIVADASIANRVADITLYAIRANNLQRRELPSIQALYQSNKLNNMAVVLLDVDYERLYYAAGYSGSDKSYGYGAYTEKKYYGA